eukprot:146684-Pelagomonas_calceolata.AAC.2
MFTAGQPYKGVRRGRGRKDLGYILSWDGFKDSLAVAGMGHTQVWGKPCVFECVKYACVAHKCVMCVPLSARERFGREGPPGRVFGTPPSFKERHDV